MVYDSPEQCRTAGEKKVVLEAGGISCRMPGWASQAGSSLAERVRSPHLHASLTHNPSMPELLSRLQSALAGRYRLDGEIGAGGMATVYVAQDLRHDRRVALKVLRPELAAVIGAERFLAEIKLTANLQHPHILPLFDSGEADSY